MSTSAVAVSFYCHTCGARFSLPAPPSPFHFTLCPRCRRDYLEDFPAPPPGARAPRPVLPPPPPPCDVPWPSGSVSSSAPSPPPPIPSSAAASSTTLTSRPETMSASQDLLPPPLPPWLLQASASSDPWNYFSNPSDCPPPPPLLRVSSSSSSSTTLPRTQVSPCTRPSSSSTRPPPPSSLGTWDYFFCPSDPVVATGKEGPPLSMSVRHQACREFRALRSQDEQHSSFPAVSPLSSAYSSACSSPPLASLLLHQHQGGELQPESPPLTLSPSTTAETMPPMSLPPPPPPLPWDSPLHGAWDDDEYSFSPPDSDHQSPPRPLPVSAYHTTFETPLRRGWSRAAPPPPVSAYDAMFDTPLQRGGSQAAPAESIAALPTVTVTDTALVCPVCTDPLLASAPVRRLPCGHLYHSDCIVKWLSLRNSCPVCRGSIPMFHSAATDIASSSSPPSLTPPGRRRSLPGGRRLRRICSRLLGRMEIRRDRQINSQTDRNADAHV